MLLPCYLLMPVLLLLCGQGAPVDLPKIDRTIAKEPVYKNKPCYCLLLLGPKAASRVWLVIDGDTLYLDRNGNGDLTEPDERRTTQPIQGAVAFGLGPVKDPKGGPPYSDLQVRLEPEDKKNKRNGQWWLEVEVDGRYRQYAIIEKLAHTAREAPIVHLGGPLQLGMSRDAKLVRGDKPTDLRVWIATEYPGLVWAPVLVQASVDLDGGPVEVGVPRNVHPIAEITFPGKTPSVQPITLKVSLTERC